MRFPYYLLVRNAFALAVFANILTCRSATAQTAAAFEGRTITAIEFPNGHPLDPADLARVLPLKTGQPLHASDVAHAIDSLYATGRFTDIVVEAQPSGTGAVVRIVTQNAQFLGGTTIKGTLLEDPNRAQVNSAAQLALGAQFHEEDVTQAVDNIHRLLQANGFYDAQITPELENGKNAQQIFVTFTIREGKRAKYEMPGITGITDLPDGTIVHATGWRLPLIHWWKHVTSSRTQGGLQGVQKEYGKKDRLMARVELKRLDYDAKRRRVRPQLDIDAGPKVKVTTVETNVSGRIMKRYVPVFQQRAVDDDLLETGRRNLQEYFQSKGYYDVNVDFMAQPIHDDQETIEYAISRGMRHKLVRVTITGNHYFDTESIRERMFMQPAHLLVVRHGRYSAAFERSDEESIKNLYAANGFRDTKVITTVTKEMRGKSGDIGVTVHIDEGPQWIVDHLVVNGAPEFRRSLSSLASEDGQPFSEVNIANDREMILTYYYNRGFPQATFNASWQTVAPGHVNVIYNVMEGNQQFVRDVLTSGLDITRPRVVEQIITMKPGDPLSPTQQTNIQKQLYDLDIFASVNTAIENPDGDTDHKYVLYHFDEANRYNLTLGFGAQLGQFGTPSSTTLASPGGTTGVSPIVSIALSRINFLGLGQTASLQGIYSNLQKRLSLTYLQPRFLNVDGQTITYTLLYENSLNVRTFAARREEASVQFSGRFSKALTATFTASYRQDSVSDIVIPVLLVSQFLETMRLGLVSSSFISDRRDNPADPHHGMYNAASFDISGRFFGSQRSFVRALLRNATYYSLGKGWVFARQTQFGVIFPFAPPAGISAQESVPLPERFYAGGADSLRAFPFNQAGPRDTGAPLVPGGPSSEPTGFPLGGNALFINNTEFRFPFIGNNVQGVLFHDMGNVYSSLSAISFRVHQDNLRDFNYMVHDVGFGVRYRTPVGPLRVDLAYSINPPSYIGFSGTPSQILNCNPNIPPSQLPSYCQSTQQNIGHFQLFFSIGQTF